MSVEVAWVALPPLGWLLWAAGGTWEKRWRRVAWPLLLGLGLGALGVSWWRSAAVACSVWVACSLGYGDGVPWPRRLCVAAGHGLALTWVRWSWAAPLVMLGVFGGQLWLSRRWNRWTWKLVEGSTGMAQGALAVWLATTPRV